MTEDSARPPATFVPVSEAMRARRAVVFLGEPWSRREIWLLVALLCVGAALRLFRLEQWSLWVDEAHTWRDATLPLYGDKGFFAGYRSYYPLSFLGLRWLMDAGLLPSHGEGWLRLPFAFAGIVSVPLLGLVGNLFVGRCAALLATAFLAVHPWHVYWSQNARGYVLVVFCVLLAVGCYWLGRRLLDWRLRAAGIAAAAVGGLCHPTGLLVLVVFVALPLADRLAAAGRRRALALGAVALTGLVLLPFAASLLPWFEGFLRAKPNASLQHYIETVAFYFRVPTLLAAAAALVLLLRGQGRAAGEGTVAFARADAHGERLRCLAVWAFVPLLAMAVFGSTIMRATARYALCALPGLLLLASAAAVRWFDLVRAGLGGGRNLATLLPASALAVVLGADFVAYDYLYYTSHQGDRADWRRARDYVLQEAQGRPFVVLTINEPSLVYYLRPNHWRDVGRPDPHPGVDVVAITKWWEESGDAEACHPEAQETGGRAYLRAHARAAAAAGAELFVVVTAPELAEMDPDRSLRDALASEFRLVRVLPCAVGPKDETIYVYRPAGTGRG
jgi:hypothetical protein